MTALFGIGDLWFVEQRACEMRFIRCSRMCFCHFTFLLYLHMFLSRAVKSLHFGSARIDVWDQFISCLGQNLFWTSYKGKCGHIISVLI